MKEYVDIPPVAEPFCVVLLVCEWCDVLDEPLGAKVKRSSVDVRLYDELRFSNAVCPWF